MKKYLLILIILVIPIMALPQTAIVPFDHVLTESELVELLDVSRSPELKDIQSEYREGQKDAALEQLANYFKEKFSERYFFDWKNFDARFAAYNKMYSGREAFHRKNALQHLELYPAATQWKIPFRNLKDEKVTSYPYRHLTRQQKAGDIALLYFYTKNQKYLNYIPEQAKSLNEAFDRGQVETVKDGNGAYESFRAGYRMFNWLFAHQCLLASPKYTWQQQIEMIRTFLHTGAQLYHHNSKYSEGNHQTRGMSALAMLSFLFPEIEGTSQWKERSLNLLEEHLNKEIYPDGFQFERSVHYHINDIENYFYPYQMARINNIELAPIWNSRIKGLFDVLTKIAMPNKKAPVLQDDTDSPWSEYNEIGPTMALGTALFADPAYQYFASSKVSSSYYWFLKPAQLARLKTIKKVKPHIGSCSLPETGYYIMRQGWDNDDLYMIISAGLTKEKPDHQHGDMLGVEAYAYGNMVLPNYQVRYNLDDYEAFKNSWVKNVMLVDSIPQGRDWTGNTGGSGFGKWAKLPQPKVLAWSVNPDFDFFAGTMDEYPNAGMKYYRSVIFIKDGFWLVNDQLISKKGKHTAQQVWQGHYDIDKNNNHIRSVFQNGAGLDIIQLGDSADTVAKSSIRSKGRAVFDKHFEQQTNWISLLYPFKDFGARLNPDKFDDFKAKGWKIFSNQNCPKDIQTDARVVLSKADSYLFMAVSEVNVGGQKISVNSQKTNLWLKKESHGLELTNCGPKPVEIKNGEQVVVLKSGENRKLKF